MIMEKTMGTGEAAGLPGIVVKRLQRWQHEGRLVAIAGTASNRRRQLRAAMESDHAAGAPDQD